MKRVAIMTVMSETKPYIMVVSTIDEKGVAESYCNRVVISEPDKGNQHLGFIVDGKFNLDSKKDSLTSRETDRVVWAVQALQTAMKEVPHEYREDLPGDGS